jgi:hypothetical protein
VQHIGDIPKGAHFQGVLTKLFSVCVQATFLFFVLVERTTPDVAGNLLAMLVKQHDSSAFMAHGGQISDHWYKPLATRECVMGFAHSALPSSSCATWARLANPVF